MNKFILFIILIAPLVSHSAPGEIRRRSFLVGAAAIPAAKIPNVVAPVVTSPPLITLDIVQARLADHMKSSGEPMYHEMWTRFLEWTEHDRNWIEHNPQKFMELRDHWKEDGSKKLTAIEVELASRYKVSLEQIIEEVERILDPGRDENWSWNKPRKYPPLGIEFQNEYLEMLRVEFPLKMAGLKKQLAFYRYLSNPQYGYALKQWDIEDQLSEQFKISREHVLDEIARLRQPYMDFEYMENFYKPRAFPQMGIDFERAYFKLLKKYVHQDNFRSALHVSRKTRRDHQRNLESWARQEAAYAARKLTESINPMSIQQGLSIANGAANVINTFDKEREVEQESLQQSCEPLLLPAPTGIDGAVDFSQEELEEAIQ